MTALLYRNAVFRPVLPGSHGVQEPLRRLRSLLGDTNLTALGTGCGEVGPGLCGNFVWSDSACGAGAKIIWNAVSERMQRRTHQPQSIGLMD